jgi:hypothetical protein
MSTLKINTLSNLAGSQSTPVENAINGSAKAWVNFNGTGTVAIRGSYNVSSITDLGSGYYRVNFTNAMPDVNYAGTYSDISWGLGYLQTFTTTSFELISYNSSFAVNDVSQIWIAIFR